MPKKIDLLQCKHPNSRKVKSLLKQKKKTETKNKNKLGKMIKKNIIGEKVLWFQNNILPNVMSHDPIQTEELIEKYLGRFNEELDQIKLKHSIGQRSNRQHASREDIINMTKKSEEEEYRTCGLEIPNVMDVKQLEMLKNWKGELRFLQNFVLKRFNKMHLESLKSKSKDLVNKSNKTKEAIDIKDTNISTKNKLIVNMDVE